MPIIYHIATAAAWQAALRDGAYTQSTLDRTLAEEGFIHASDASQATWVANKFYRGVPDLVLLVIDTGKLTAPLEYEEVPGWDVPFPHIYGPLNPSAVTQATPLAPGPDGTFAIDPLTMMPSGPAEAIELVVQASHALAAAGQADMVWGHASVRDPAGRGAWLKSAGWGFEEVDAGKVVLVSPGGEVLEGSGRRHIEYPIHTEIMARRADVGAVVHTHSDAANAFAALDVPMRPLSHAGSLFSYPDVPRFTLTGGLIRSRELGQALADALGDAPACLMPQHGLVTAGPDLPAAVMTAVLLDRACRTQLTAMAAGPLRRWGDEEDTVAKRAEAWAPSQLRAGWEYLVRNSAGGRP